MPSPTPSSTPFSPTIPKARVACETLVTTGLACVAGEITTTTYVPVPDIVRATIERIGYTDAAFGFDSKTCAVISTIDRQSPDIAMGVDTGGAGDQGMMFGYATDETDELMPMPILLAHRHHRGARRPSSQDGDAEWLRPDGKAQVTVVYEDKQPVAVDTVVVSTQHAESVTRAHDSQHDHRAGDRAVDSRRAAQEESDLSHQPDGTVRHRRPAGRRGSHGPQDHRRHVRRHGTTRRRRVQRQGSVEGRSLGVLRGAVGGEEHRRRQACAPVRGAARVRDRRRRAGVGHGRYVRDVDRPEATIMEAVQAEFDLTPRGIIEALDLRKPIYSATSAYGHFGREPRKIGRGRTAATEFSWERTDRAKALARAVR